MADIDTIRLPDGNIADLPAWAKDATLQTLIDETRKQNTLLSKNTESVSKVLRALEKMQSDGRISTEGVQESLKGLDSSIQSSTRKNQGAGKALGALGWAASHVTGAIKGMSLATLGVSAQMFAAGDALEKLNLAGVAVNQSFAGVGDDLVGTVSQLSTVTGSFEESTRVISSFPGEFLVQGGNNFVATMLYASDSAEMLGLSMSQSMAQFGGALETRRRLLDVGAVDQARMNQNIRRNVTLQRELGAVLGVSVDELASFTEQLLGNNDMLQVNFLRFNNSVRENLVTSITDFASVLRAKGGEVGGDIAGAFLEAANVGAIGMSDAASELVSVLPSLAEPMNRFITQFQRGELDAQGLSDAVTGLLGNLSRADRDRLFALRNISPAARQLAAAAVQMEQAQRRAAAQGLDFSTLQQGTRNFREVITRISGFFSDVFFSTFADPRVMQAVEDVFSAFKNLIGFDENGKRIADTVRDMADWVIPKLVWGLEWLATGIRSLDAPLASFLESFKEFPKEFMDEAGNINWTDFWNGLSSRLDKHVIEPLGRWFSERFTTFIREAFQTTLGAGKDGAGFLGGMLGDLGANVSEGAQAVMNSEVVQQLGKSDLAKSIAITTGAFAAMKIAQSAPSALMFGAIAAMFVAAQSAFTAVPDLAEKIEDIALTLGGLAVGGALAGVAAVFAPVTAFVATVLAAAGVGGVVAIAGGFTKLAEGVDEAAASLSKLINVADNSPLVQRLLGMAPNDDVEMDTGSWYHSLPGSDLVAGVASGLGSLAKGAGAAGLGLGSAAFGGGLGSALEDMAEGLNMLTDNLAGIEMLERLFGALLLSQKVSDPMNVVAVAVESLADSMESFRKLRMSDVVDRISEFVIDLNRALHGLDLSNIILTARAMGELERNTSRLVNMRPVAPTQIETPQQANEPAAAVEPEVAAAAPPTAAEPAQLPVADLAAKMDTMITLLTSIANRTKPLRNIENKIESG